MGRSSGFVVRKKVAIRECGGIGSIWSERPPGFIFKRRI
jgi:hypothetical protein